jgi:hypothetical protein
MYTVSTFSYLSTGGDGFGMMKDCKFVVDQVSGIDLLTLLLRFFKESEAANFIKN